MWAQQMTYLLGFSRNEVANGLAEKTGEQRIERWLVVQEVVKKAQQSLVPTESVIDLGHIASQQLAGCVGISERAQC